MKLLSFRPLIVIGLAATLSACASQAPAAKAPAASTGVKTALWVGNSFFYYNNSMHSHVAQLISNANPGVGGYRAVSATTSGSGINWHDVEAHFKPGGVSSYSFTPTNEVVFNKFDKPFDVAIMMDCSQCPVHPKLQPVFYEYVAKHSGTVRKYGAEPALFMSWAYQDKPEMTQQLADEYIKAGKAVNATVIPAGIAFAKSMAMKPEINLYASDKRHPSLAGTYLGAATVMASVYKQNPVGNKYTAGLPEDVARHLQNVAWETVQSFKM